jgi:starch synthase
VSAETPLLTCVSRLAEQKGINLIIANIERWIKRGYQLVILGAGDPEIEQLLQKLANRYPQQLYFCRGFNDSLARQIYAGGDLLLMPSHFEPCGLGQMIAMRYGTVPVVRATGGLRDTVTDYNASKSKATGVHFSKLTPRAFDIAIEQVVSLYRTPRTWSRIRSNALKRDSSWDASAQTYLQLYQSLIGTQTGKSR